MDKRLTSLSSDSQSVLPRLATSALLGEIVRNANYGAQPRSTESETLGQGPNIFVLMSCSGDSEAY